MTPDGFFRVLNMRIDELDKEVEYLYSCNPMSSFPGSTETTNPYANGRIVALREEKQFILTVLRQMIPITNPKTV